MTEDPSKTSNRYRQAEEAIRESEARYRSLFEDSPISLWEEDFSKVKNHLEIIKSSGVKDLRKYFDEHLEEVEKCASLVKIIDVNKSTLELLEARNKEELFQGLSKIFTPESLDIFKEEVLALSRGDMTFEAEAPHKTLKGNLKQIMLKLTLVPEYSKNWSKVFISLFDITDLKHIEDKLRESEEKFRYLFESSPLSIILINNKGKIVDMNPVCEDLVGYTKEEVIGKRYAKLNIVLPEYLPLLLERLKKISRGEKQPPINVQMKKKDGKIIWVNLLSNIIKMGTELYLITVGYDITEQYTARQELKISEEKYRFLFENAPASILLMDNKGTMVDINPRLVELSGYTREELVGKKYIDVDLIRRKYIPRLLKRLQKILEGQNLPPINLEVKTKDGKRLWFNFETTKIELGDEIYIQSIGHDITHEKKIQEKYLNAYNHASFYKDLFAHDMKNILHSIHSSVELYSLYKDKDKTLEDIDELFEIINDQAQRGTNLITNVQKLSEIEEHKVSLEKLEILSILKEAIDFLKNTFKSRKINVKVKARLENYFVYANELLLDVFENLLINSVKHNDNDVVEIQIKISKEKKNIKIQFIDNAKGIPDNRKEKIFQRVSQEDRSISGSGLGLSLVKFIIDAYNGDISVENRIRGDYSKGSNFTVYIPEAK
jgi:PAS domain S-box-containing protein